MSTHSLQYHRGSAVILNNVCCGTAFVTVQEEPDFTLTLEEAAGSGLSAIAELALSRVALEAITNLVRHAFATHAEVSLQRIGSEVVLRVSDDGRGSPLSCSNSVPSTGPRPSRWPATLVWDCTADRPRITSECRDRCRDGTLAPWR